MLITFIERDSTFIKEACSRHSLPYKEIREGVIIVSSYFASIWDDIRSSDNDALSFIAMQAASSYNLHMFIGVKDRLHYDVAFDCYVLRETQNTQLALEVKMISKATGLPASNRIELEAFLSSMPTGTVFSETQDLNDSLNQLRKRIANRNLVEGGYSFL